MSKRPFQWPFLLAAVFLATSAAPAFAAKRKVPFGFFGTVYNVEADNVRRLCRACRDQQLDLMARSGVESDAPFLAWPVIETGPGVYNWSDTDRVVAAAARHRISMLGNVLGTPMWASTAPDLRLPRPLPPKDPP